MLNVTRLFAYGPTDRDVAYGPILRVRSGIGERFVAERTAPALLARVADRRPGYCAPAGTIPASVLAEAADQSGETWAAWAGRIG